MIVLWNQIYTREIAAVRKIVEGLDEINARLLFSQEDANIPLKYRSAVEVCINRSVKDDEVDQVNNIIKLDKLALAIIRSQAVSFLNFFECVASAWYHSVADREMIKQQFSPFIDETNGFTLLQTFRKACGGADTYPDIQNFVYAVNEARERNILRAKKPL